MCTPPLPRQPVLCCPPPARRRYTTAWQHCISVPVSEPRIGSAGGGGGGRERRPRLLPLTPKLPPPETPRPDRAAARVSPLSLARSGERALAAAAGLGALAGAWRAASVVLSERPRWTMEQ